jgi:hypothetical protein
MQSSTEKVVVTGSSETLYLCTIIQLATFQKTVFDDILCIFNNQKLLRPAVNSCFYYFVSCQRESTIFQQKMDFSIKEMHMKIRLYNIDMK